MPNTIAQNLTRLANAKEAIAEAIEAKGITLGENDGFEDFADAIMEISGGGTIETKVKLLKSIKSEGNSIIRTDIIPQFTDEVHMSVKFTGERSSSSATDCFFGVQGGDPWYLAANPSGQDCSVFIGFDYTQTPVYLNNAIKLNSIIPIILRRSNKVIIGEESGTITTAITGQPHDFGCSFFGVSSATSQSLYGYYNMTIYDVKFINSSGAVIYHLVPAEDWTTHRGGLYDLITGNFYPAHENYDDVIKETGAIEILSDYIGVSCTAQEYAAMQIHNSNTIYTVTDGNAIYKYLGDDPIGYTVVSKGYFNPGKFFDEWKWQSRDRAGGAYTVTSKQTGFAQPATGTCFDRSKAWDIVACVYLKDPMQRMTYATGALFGGAGNWPKFSGYPSAEMLSSGNMFFGISEDGDGWTKSINISKSILDGILVAGLNYLKFSYDGTSAIAISHSRDSINYTIFYTDSINFTPTNVPNDGLNMVFTGVEAHPFPMDIDYHMVIHECKIYSEGELILGHEVLPKPVSPIPEQKLTAVQGGWRPAGNTGYEYPERYDATSDPSTAPLRCCLPTYIYNVGGSNGQISCEGSGIMANIRDLTFNSSSGQLIVIQNNVTDWLPMPISLTNYATNTPLCITFKKTDGTQTLLPNEIGTITIS